MKSIVKKMKSKSGVSMIAALLFLLLCAMVGGVVLTAASVSAGKVQRDRVAYQKTLAAASAVELMRKDLEGLQFTGVYKKVVPIRTTITPRIDADGNPMLGDDGQPLYTTTVLRGEAEYSKVEADTGFNEASLLLKGNDLIDLGDIFYQSVAELSPSATPGEISCQLTFPENSTYNFPAVVGTLKIDNAFRITLELALEDEPDKAVMHLSAKGVKSGPAESTAMGSAYPDPYDPNTTIQEETTTYTVTITWPESRIEEGSAA